MILLLSGLAAAEEERPISWYALPTLDYSSDFGFGFGVAGGVNFEREGFAPYRSSIQVDAYATTKRIQAHRLWFDVLRFADLPLRVQGSLGFDASISDNYCGIAGEPDCVLPDADPTYYQLRHSEPTGSLNGLWQPEGWPAALFVGWSGARYRPGVFTTTTPYPDSLYAESFPEGETGLSSTAQVGVMRDTRDAEYGPTSGIWAEASARGSHRLIGSRWDSIGSNATFRSYLSLTGRLVWASRLVLDGVWGEQPTLERAAFGGWWGGWGLGGDMGRGIRDSRYIGSFKALGQQELRWMPIVFEAWDSVVQLGGVAFADGGAVTAALSEAGVAAWGTGGGIRFQMDDDFILRFDMGFSPVEGWSPYSYIDFGHAF